MDLPRTYDALLDKHRGSIPIEYLRALIQKESSFDPNAGKGGGASGLMQITGVALTDYNDLNPRKRFDRSQMFDPESNIIVGTWLLNRIIANWAQTEVKELHPDFRRLDFVRLLTAGWNSGWVGVRNTAQQLHVLGNPVTHGSVMERWRRINPTLASVQKEKWQRNVADLYFAHIGTDPVGNDNGNGGNGEGIPVAVDPETTTPLDTGDIEVEGPWMTGTRVSVASILGIGLGLGLLAWIYSGGKKR